MALPTNCKKEINSSDQRSDNLRTKLGCLKFSKKNKISVWIIALASKMGKIKKKDRGSLIY